MRKIGIIASVCVAIVLCLVPQTAVAWGWTTHRGASAYAAYYGEHNSPTVEANWYTLREESVTPDTWGESAYYHGYNVWWGIGGAPGRCEKYANEAIDYIAQGDKHNAMIRLAWASHYMEDMSQPWHTVFWSNVWNADKNDNGRNDHYDYEEWVDNNFYAGKNFYRAAYYGAVDSNDYAAVSDVSDAAIELAEYSNDYADEVTDNNWEKNPEATYNCVWYGTAYTAELYDFVAPYGY